MVADEHVGQSTRPSLDLRSHLDALRRFWKSILLFTLLGIAAAVALTLTAQPTYETRMTFFVATSYNGADGSPLQADEFAQRRINSYVGVVNSERMAQLVVDDTGLPLDPADVAEMISASSDPDTVLMNVTVTDTVPDRSLTLARSIESNLDTLIGQLDNRGTRSAVELRVISGPTLNPDPVTPRTKLNLGLGLLLGLGVGIAQALLRRQFDTSVRNRDQLVGLTGLPALAALQYDSSARKAPVLKGLGTGSARAEGFRQLRTNLQFIDAAHPVRVVVVASSVEGEGKTTTAANLAEAFAETGQRVLLVDADLRKPALERYLGIAGTSGLTDVLTGKAGLRDVVQEWGPSGLAVLPTGALPPNPSELLGSPAMRQLLEQARSEYQVVVLDTPALLPVTDAAVAAALADGVVFLVRHGQIRREQVQQSLDALASVRARVLGTVLSMAPAGESSRPPAAHPDWAAPARTR